MAIFWCPGAGQAPDGKQDRHVRFETSAGEAIYPCVSSPSVYRPKLKLPRALMSRGRMRTETAMRRIPDTPDEPAFTFTASASRRAQRSDDELGLDCLARTLDQAALNVSAVALDGARDAALRLDPRAAADAARGMADQITGQLKALELALSEVVLPANR
jgi:hypothetical protein